MAAPSAPLSSVNIGNLPQASQDIILKIKAEKEGASKTIKSLRQELREAVQDGVAISRQFGDNSKEAGKAAAKVALLRDEMEDFNQKVKALNPDKFARFATGVNGIVNGFQAAQGAAVLFGAESEDLQKTMVKLQAVMAFSQGIQGVLDARKAFGGLATTIKTSVVTAFTTLRGALIATGIGALVVGLGLLVSNFDKVKAAIMRLYSPWLKLVADAFGGLMGRITDFVGITTKAGRELDAMIEKSEEALTKNEAFLDRNLDKYDKHTQAKLQADVDYQKKKLELDKQFDKDNDKAAHDRALNEIAEQFNRTVAKAEAERKNEAQIAAKKIADDKKTAADKKAAEAERDAAEAKAVKDKAEAFNLYLRKAGIAQKNAEAKIRNEAIDKEIKDNLSAAEALKKIQTDYAEWLLTHNEEVDKQERASRKAMNDMAVSGTQGLIANLQDINELSAGQTEEQQKRAFKRGQALAIADTTISTYTAAQKSYESLSGIPYVGPVLGALAAAAAIAAGLLRINAIKNQKFMGSGASGGGAAPGSGGQGGGMAAASTGFSFVKAPAQQGQGVKIDQKPIKVYVVSKDMTVAQRDDNTILSKAVVK